MASFIVQVIQSESLNVASILKETVREEVSYQVSVTNRRLYYQRVEVFDVQNKLDNSKYATSESNTLLLSSTIPNK